MFRFSAMRSVRGRTMYGATAIGVLSAALISSGGAQSVTDPQCPPALPVSGVTPHMPVTGLTVSSGTAPEPFAGEVLGTFKGGIAAGVDMIMVRLTSPEIDRVGGIWQGMSGSPVYDEDGNLVGAVSYGLALGPSPVAGVTPAENMQDLLDNGPAALALPRRTADRIVADGAATRAQAEAGLTRLPLPLGVSGMATSKRLRQAGRLLDLDDVRLFRAGASSESAPATEIVAGGNLAASVSYGDVTSAGVGTATAVCGDEVIAFGHPMLWSGP
ncbi:MAG: SpoIVB peptidase S55 domain-containing protein, partial [Nocardioidaceae bacterium]